VNGWTGRGRRGVRRAIAGCIPALIVVGACSSDDGQSSTTTAAAVVETSTESTVAALAAGADDGVLTIGALLALTGPGADFGAAARIAIEMAVNDVNASGGVNGEPVRLVIRDEGAEGDIASAAVDELIRVDVDAIVGPMSSLIAPIVLPTTVAEGVLSCSPSATTQLLDAFPDRGLFIRTIPSDALQAVAIAKVVEQTGVGSAAILHVDDAFGRPFAALVREQLSERGVTVGAVASVSATGDSSPTQIAAAVEGAGVVVVIADGESGPRIVANALAEGGPDLQFVVNDALRVALGALPESQLGAEDLARISGVSPQLRIPSGPFLDAFSARAPSSAGLTAANAYDCVNLVALAAATGSSSVGRVIAEHIVEVSASGTRCTSFASCEASRVAGRNIDYDGALGDLQIGDTGDPVRAVFDVFGFDARGDAVVIGEVLAA
jgi:branched-chain amino acid transport system substrate-binding protein